MMESRELREADNAAMPLRKFLEGWAIRIFGAKD